MKLHITEVVGLLEIVASEQPELLLPLLETLQNSPSHPVVIDLASDWRVDPAELPRVAPRVARQLRRIEMRRRRWNHPREIVEQPNVRALYSFAYARFGRVSGITRSKRLNVLARKLQRIALTEHRREQLDAFLREPVKPVDPEWLRDFLKRPRTARA